MENKKTEHVLYGTLFVVEMYRWGEVDTDVHHYTAGIFDNEKDAKVCGIAEHYWRGTKYEPVIYKHKLNEWRNGKKRDMYKEIESYDHDCTIEELWTKKEAWSVRQKRENPEEYKKYKLEKLRKKYGPEKEDGRE